MNLLLGNDMAIFKDRGMVVMTTDRRKGSYVIKPVGRITFKNSDDMRCQWLAVIRSNSYRQIILDMSDVSFVDSSAMSVVIAVSKECKKISASFTIINCQKRVRELFKTLRIDMIIPMREE